MLDVVTYALAKAFTKKSLAGTMQKSVYDADDDGVVDNSKRLNGNRSSYYAKETDMIHGFTVDDNGNLCQIIE